MKEDHPFVKWWIEKSGWHDFGKEWPDSLACSEGVLAIDAWNAALGEVDDAIVYDRLCVRQYTGKTARERTCVVCEGIVSKTDSSGRCNVCATTNSGKI